MVCIRPQDEVRVQSLWSNLQLNRNTSKYDKYWIYKLYSICSSRACIIVEILLLRLSESCNVYLAGTRARQQNCSTLSFLL